MLLGRLLRRDLQGLSRCGALRKELFVVLDGRRLLFRVLPGHPLPGGGRGFLQIAGRTMQQRRPVLPPAVPLRRMLRKPGGRLVLPSRRTVLGLESVLLGEVPGGRVCGLGAALQAHRGPVLGLERLLLAEL